MTHDEPQTLPPELLTVAPANPWADMDRRLAARNAIRRRCDHLGRLEGALANTLNGPRDALPFVIRTNRGQWLATDGTAPAEELDGDALVDGRAFRAFEYEAAAVRDAWVKEGPNRSAEVYRLDAALRREVCAAHDDLDLALGLVAVKVPE